MRHRCLCSVAVVVLAACDDSARTVDPRRAGGQVRPTAASRAASAARLDSLAGVAGHLYERGSYDSARTAYRQVLADATSLGDSATAARALTSIGLAGWRLGDYAEARAAGEQALAMKRRLGLRSDLFRSFNALGLLARDDGRTDEALAMFDSALVTAGAIGDRLGEAKVTSNKALIQSDVGQLDAARSGFISARTVAREVGDVITEWNAVVGLAALTIRLGDPLGAIADVEDLRRRHRKPDHPVGEENAYGQLATAYDMLGETQRAIAALDSALRIARIAELPAQEAEDLKLLAEIYDRTGDRRRALSLLDDAFVIDSTIGAPDEIADVLLRRGAILGSLGDASRARASVARGLAIHRQLNSRFDVLSDLLTDAELAARTGDSSAIRERVMAARGLADTLAVPGAHQSVALSLMRIADREGDSREVLRLVDSVRFDRSAAAASSAWEVDALAARAHRRLGDLGAAIARGQRAVAEIERLRRSLWAGELRTALVSDRADVYADLVLALLGAGRASDALDIADRSRSRALLDNLNAARLDARDTTTAALMSERVRLLGRIDFLLRQLSPIADPRRREREIQWRATEPAIAAELAARQREYDELLVRYPGARWHRMLAGTDGADVRAIRSALHDDEALLEYFVTASRTFVFIVRRSGIRIVSTAVAYEDLVARVRLARDLASSSNGADSATHASMLAVFRALNEKLIGPVVTSGALRGVRQLVIVPHGALTYLPFAALESPSGRSLIEDFTLLYLPVAAALPVLRDSGGSGTRANEPVIALSPFPLTLPSSRGEARGAAESRPGSTVLEGPKATERELRRALEAGAIVHVASHGVMEAESPMFSRLELARGDGSPSDNGRLEVHEVLALSITSPLVFLSGCETGSGTAWSSRYSRSSDHATLEQAFLLAGASTVIATRWQVEDRSAAVIATRFYVHLASHDAADALALAQRDLIRDPQYRAPHYWAAYFVSGSGTVSNARSPAAESEAATPSTWSKSGANRIAGSVSLMSQPPARP